MAGNCESRANSGYDFIDFAGSLTGSVNPAIVTMNSAATVSANFGCGYTLSSPSAAVGAAAGSGSFTFSGGASACTVTVSSNSAWLTATRVGPTVNFNFAANPGGQRVGILSIGTRTFTVTQASATPPSASASGPLAGSGVNQALTFRFSHPQGFGQLDVVNVLINTALDAGNACYVAYSQTAGVLFLVNDAGPAAGLSEPLVLGSAAAVSNRQCTIRGTGSSASGAGNVLTLVLNISFTSTFTGSRVIYTAARDTGTGNSGWQTLGSSQIPETSPTFPRTGPLVPAAVSTASQVLSVTFQEAVSATTIQTGWILINTAVDARRACYVAYFAPANLVFLFPDDGDAAQIVNMVLSGTNTVENSQCRINAQGSSTVVNGGQLTLNLNVTTKGAFAGPRGVWTAMQNAAAQTSPWRISGAWLVP